MLDWGLAKLCPAAADDTDTTEDTPSDQTAAGEVRGTPAYLSPEQANGQPELISPATDVFGLGATLYAILTGAPPYQGPTPAEVTARAQAADFVPPRHCRPAVPAALDAVCRKAMSPRPEDRYASAADLARDVENWLAGERVTAWLSSALAGPYLWQFTAEVSQGSAGVFRPGAQDLSAVKTAYDAVLADVDGDGDLDALARGSDAVILLRNAGDGTFEDLEALSVFGKPLVGGLPG